jgi:hypothetical protein
MDNHEKNELIEGATNQNSSDNNPMILAQKNAGTIQYLQERMNELQTLEKNFTTLQTDVKNNTNAIKQMGKFAAQHITQTAGVPASGPPPAVKGLSSISNDAANSPSTTQS